MSLDPKTERYWCDLPPDEFAEEFFKRTPSPSAAPSGIAGMLQTLLLDARSAFYGALPGDWAAAPSSAEVKRDGAAGEIVTLKVNHTRSNALAQHQIVTAPPLSWQAQAVNSDSKSMAGATRGSKILEYLWKNSSCDEKLISATLGAIIYGEDFIFSPWSTMAGELKGVIEGRVVYKGDIVDHPVPTWDVLRDATAKSYDGSRWKCVRLHTNKWELIAEFPAKRDDILALPASAPSADSDRIPTYYFFHERTPALPSGLQAILLSGKLWLAHGPLEECYCEVLPIHRVAAGELKGTPWAYSSFWEAMAIQQLSDDIQSSLATNIVAFGKQLLSAESDQNLPIDDIANGPKVMYRPKGSPAPTPMQLTAQPPSAFEHLNELKGDSREAFGLNDIAMGQVDTAQMNAQAFALIASMAVQQNSDLQKRYVKAGTQMGRSRLRIFRAKASEPRKVAIIGKHGPLNAIQEMFTGADFSPLDDVYAEVASPLSQTAAGRMQLGQLYIDRGFVLTPEQLQSLVETGRLDPLTQGLQSELIYIAEENEGLLKGEPQAVKITDSHQMHIREHKATTFSAQARADPQINIVTDQHIKEHLDMLLNTDPRILAAMGQAAPAPAMPPPGAPPPGGPPGPGGPPDALAGPLEGQPSAADVPAIPPPMNPLNGEPFQPGGGPPQLPSPPGGAA